MTDIQIKNAADRADAKAKVDQLAAQVKSGELDDAGKADLAALIDGVKAFDEVAAKALESKALLDAVASLGGEPAKPDDGSAKAASSIGRKHLSFTGGKARAAAGQLAKGMLGGVGTKSIVAAGSTITGVPLEDKTPIELNRIPTSFLDVLASKAHATPTYTYLRQSLRDNHAAVWTSGAKAESKYEITSVDGKLDIVAHISDGLSTYDSLDNAELAAFIEAEMLYGLRLAVEAKTVAEVLAAPGIAAQAFDTDLIVTARKAVTLAETAGHTAGVFIFSPADWESISLARNSGGSFDLGNVAVDRAAQRLHGVPVVVSNAVPADTAVLLDLAALRVDTDTHGVQIAWGTKGNDFAENAIRARTELRTGTSVLKPGGVVKIATASE